MIKTRSKIFIFLFLAALGLSSCALPRIPTSSSSQNVESSSSEAASSSEIRSEEISSSEWGSSDISNSETQSSEEGSSEEGSSEFQSSEEQSSEETSSENVDHIKNIFTDFDDPNKEIIVAIDSTRYYSDYVVLTEILKRQYPNLPFKLVNADSPYIVNATEDFMKEPASKNAPDLLLTHDNYIRNLADKKIIASVDKKEDIEYVEKTVLKVGKDMATYNGKLYAYPNEIDAGYFLWYDTEYLNNNEVESLETILAKAESLNKSIVMDLENAYYFNSLMSTPQGLGLDSIHYNINDNQCSYTVNWDSAFGVKTCSYLSNLLNYHFINGTLISGYNEDISKGFENRSVIAGISGEWLGEDLQRRLNEAYPRIGAVKLPSYHMDGNEYQMSSFATFNCYVVNSLKSKQHQMVAHELAKILINEEAQMKRMQASYMQKTLNLSAIHELNHNSSWIDKSYKALTDQMITAPVIQSKTVEGRYWDVSARIGRAVLHNEYDDNGQFTSWEAFLNYMCNMLREKMPLN